MAIKKGDKYRNHLSGKKNSFVSFSFFFFQEGEELMMPLGARDFKVKFEDSAPR